MFDYETILKKLADPAGPVIADGDECAARYNDSEGDLRGILGLYLFNAAVEFSRHERPTRLKQPHEYLQDPLVINALYRVYDIDARVRSDLEPLEFFKVGTTSIILRSNNRRVLKLIKPRFWNVESITNATKQYKKKYGNLGKFCPEVYEFGSTWILMEFLEGVSLTDYSIKYLHALFREPHEKEEQLSQVQEIISQLCAALYECANRATAVHHLDLSPDNVIIEYDYVTGKVHTVKLIDFGVNYLLTEHVGSLGDLSRAQVFIADELKRGGPGSELSDVASLGLILLEMLSTEVLTIEELSVRFDSAWSRCPELAALVEDMIDDKPTNRLLKIERGPQVFRALPGMIADAIKTHVYVELRKRSGVEIFFRCLPGIPIDSIIELSRRANLPHDHAQPGLRWALFWGLLIQALYIVALSVSVWVVVYSFDFRLCEYFGTCLAPRDSPPLPLGNGALWGRVNSFLPGRLVAASSALVLATYYAAIFGALTTGHLRLKGMRVLGWGSEVLMRSFPLLGMVPIFYAELADPQAWPLCSAAGLTLTCLTNLVVYKLGRRAQREITHSFQLPRSPFIDEQLKTFSLWWERLFIYLGGVTIIWLVLRSGLAQDEWLYATFVSIFVNLLLMYRHHCTKAAPALRSALHRLVLGLRRLELKKSREANTASPNHNDNRKAAR